MTTENTTPPEPQTPDVPKGALPNDIREFVDQATLLATNHGGWFDAHGFKAISPLCDKGNVLLEKYAAAEQPAIVDTVADRARAHEVGRAIFGHPAPVEPGSEREERPTISESRLRVILAKEAKDWRHNAYSRVTFARLHDALSLVLASEAHPAADGAK